MQRLTLQYPSLKIALERFVGRRKKDARATSLGTGQQAEEMPRAWRGRIGSVRKPTASEPFVQGG